MKIGFNQATSMGCSSVEEDISLCEKYGFDFIEFRFDKLKEYLNEHSIEDLKYKLSKTRIKPHALNALYMYDNMFNGINKISDIEFENEFIWACSLAKSINSKYLIVVPPLQRDPNGGPYIGDAFETHKNCVRILKILSKIAIDYNVNICFEPVGFKRSSVRTIQQSWDIVNEVDEDNVGLVLDSYNLHLFHGLNDFSEIKEIDNKKIFCVHINNGDYSNIDNASQENRKFCDSGTIDLNNFLQNLKNVGYSGMVSVEIFRPEYWNMSPEWVISNAYQTTIKIMENNGVYSH